MTITEFLLARIAEDEARYEALGYPDDAFWVGGALADTVRELAQRLVEECAAKRRIVELHESWPVLVETPGEIDLAMADDPSQIAYRASRRLAWLTEREYRNRFGEEPPTAPIVAALASVYADHPDYREEWRA